MDRQNGFGHIFTVSELTGEIKSLLEDEYPFVWITGEISNFIVAASGHAYFSLKDDSALINCVMFKNQKKRLLFNPENGMKITGMGRISLYEPRGGYQLIFEHLEPEGAGSLQIQFEQLKKKLSREGLFDKSAKKNIPFLPSKISIITSPKGAAVRDIISVSRRRFPDIHLEIIPVMVQGADSAQDIADALQMANDHGTDVIILARGGGSLEDLAAFNSENVARAIFHSSIPVISAVGHETDFTISDFAADLRAPTPSAAAELALPEKIMLLKTVTSLEISMATAIKKQLTRLEQKLADFKSRLKSPLSIVHDMRFKLEDLEKRMNAQVRLKSKMGMEKLNWFTNALHANNPQKRISRLKEDVARLTKRMNKAVNMELSLAVTRLNEASKTLQALSPMAVLERGYSISRTYPEKEILRYPKQVDRKDVIEIILAKGRLLCQVKKT